MNCTDLGDERSIRLPSEPGRQVNDGVSEGFGGDGFAGEDFWEIFLVGLAEGETVEKSLLFHFVQPLVLFAGGHLENETLEFAAFANPPRGEAGFVAEFRVGAGGDVGPGALVRGGVFNVCSVFPTRPCESVGRSTDDCGGDRDRSGKMNR